MPGMLDHIAHQLSQHANTPVQIRGQRQIFGGDINQAFHLQTNIGSFFLKLNDRSFEDMFQREFEGLQALYQTKSIRIPKPILYGSFSGNVIPAKAGIRLNSKHIFLLTEFIEKGTASKTFWQTFAYRLAALHKHSNQQFGLSSNNYIGSLKQSNNFCKTWSDFYANQRIMPLMQLAFSQDKCSMDDVLKAEKLCKRFDEIFPDERPALVHGDLWSGNFMCSNNGEPVMYDPAIYYGNREMDIAMSLLFGGFDKSFYIHYNEVFPLQQGWRERIELCQLYPLAVHLVLFGGHYYYNLMKIIENYV